MRLWCVVCVLAMMAFSMPIRAEQEAQPSYKTIDVEQVASAIKTLQPAANEQRANRLAELIVDAATESDLDPLLIVAVAMRESSFNPAVESLMVKGSRGELGLLQVHPKNRRALDMRPDDCDRGLSTARCQIVTGARWLAYSRSTCPGSTWRWIVAYGSGQCVSEKAARINRGAAVAASFYARVGGVDWR